MTGVLSPVALVRGVALVLAALATSVGAALLSPVLPDLAVLVVVATALLSGPRTGVAVGLAAGWLLDLVPPGAVHLGTGALLYAGAGLLAGRGRREGPAPLAWLLLVLAASAAVPLAGPLLEGLLGGSALDWGGLALRWALTVALGVVVVPVLVAGQRALARRGLA